MLLLFTYSELYPHEQGALLIHVEHADRPENVLLPPKPDTAIAQSINHDELTV